MVRAERRFNRTKGIERTVERGFHPRTALSVGFLACLAARVGGRARALPPVLPASVAQVRIAEPAPRRGNGWTCHFARFAAVGISGKCFGSSPTWQLGRPVHPDWERVCKGRP